MDKEQIKRLMPKYLAGDCNEEEMTLMETWYNHYLEDTELKVSEEQILESTERIQNRLNSLIAPKTRTLFKPLAVAASILLAVAIGIYLFTGNLYKSKDTQLSEINPGKHDATLTLADGKEIKLSNVGNGDLAKELGLTITKTADGQLVYQIEKQTTTGNRSGTGLAHHTLSTSNGEIFQLILPDGSKVWLNAASKLNYSVSLATDHKRVVNLNGEAYFEVFKDKKHPFIVRTSKQEIEVLGTHFNINSYDDEQVTKTTLIEGLVKVRLANEEALLRPGQESSVDTKGINIRSVDTEGAIAWKNGKFLFNDEALESIMRKISKWYNVEVVYTSEDIKTAQFYAMIDRFSSIEEVLKVLRLTRKVSFRIEGRQITVSKAEQ